MDETLLLVPFQLTSVFLLMSICFLLLSLRSECESMVFPYPHLSYFVNILVYFLNLSSSLLTKHTPPVFNRLPNKKVSSIST